MAILSLLASILVTVSYFLVGKKNENTQKWAWIMAVVGNFLFLCVGLIEDLMVGYIFTSFMFFMISIYNACKRIKWLNNG